LAIHTTQRTKRSLKSEDFHSSANKMMVIESLIDINKPVTVYKNLHKKLFSVKQDGIVQFYTDTLCMKDVKFVVQQAGRRRVVAEKKKNVHAFVKGFIVHPSTAPYDEKNPWQPVRYNPYEMSQFQLAGQDLESAEYIDLMIDAQMLVWNPS
jgi:hypothetical protein